MDLVLTNDIAKVMSRTDLTVVSKIAKLNDIYSKAHYKSIVRHKEMENELSIRDFRSRFPEINATKFALLMGVDDAAFRRYICDCARPHHISPKRLAHIERKLHELGQLMLNTKLTR